MEILIAQKYLVPMKLYILILKLFIINTIQKLVNKKIRNERSIGKHLKKNVILKSNAFKKVILEDLVN